MAESECATGFSCLINSDGAYECVPSGLDSSGSESESTLIDEELKATCDTSSAVITGSLETSITTLTFDTVMVEMYHKLDIDEFEDGCITEVQLSLQSGQGCTLKVTAGESYIGMRSERRLKVNSIEFSADSFCPNFPDAEEGVYEGIDGLSRAEVLLDRTDIPGYNVPQLCVAPTLTLSFEGRLAKRDEGNPLTVTSSITLDTEVISIGETDRFCPTYTEISAGEEPTGGEDMGGEAGEAAGEMSTGTGSWGDECSTDNDCSADSTLCVVNPMIVPPGYCSKPCNSTTQCADIIDGWTCNIIGQCDDPVISWCGPNEEIAAGGGILVECP